MNGAGNSPYLHCLRKRCFDIAVCLLLLPPAVVLMALTALVVWAVDGRPILLVQDRAGLGGRAFRMPKFRTLRSWARQDEFTPEHRHAANLTRTGGFLRRTRLDELPQILLVLAGRMSLVGPRPELTGIASRYTHRHARRLAARPGLTGLWQVKGSRERPIHQQMKYDLYYLRKACLCLDIRIVMMTVKHVLTLGRRPGERG